MILNIYSTKNISSLNWRRNFHTTRPMKMDPVPATIGGVGPVQVVHSIEHPAVLAICGLFFALSSAIFYYRFRMPNYDSVPQEGQEHLNRFTSSEELLYHMADLLASCNNFIREWYSGSHIKHLSYRDLANLKLSIGETRFLFWELKTDINIFISKPMIYNLGGNFEFTENVSRWLSVVNNFHDYTLFTTLNNIGYQVDYFLHLAELNLL